MPDRPRAPSAPVRARDARSRSRAISKSKTRIWKRRSNRQTVSSSVGAPATARLARKTLTKSRMPFRGEILLVDVRREGRAVRQLPRPMQDLLARVLDSRGGSRDRNGQLVLDCLEPGFARPPTSAPRHPRIPCRSGKRQRALCLDFEDCVGAVGVGGMDDDIV